MLLKVALPLIETPASFFRAAEAVREANPERQRENAPRQELKNEFFQKYDVLERERAKLCGEKEDLQRLVASKAPSPSSLHRLDLRKLAKFY